MTSFYYHPIIREIRYWWGRRVQHWPFLTKTSVDKIHLHYHSQIEQMKSQHRADIAKDRQILDRISGEFLKTRYGKVGRCYYLQLRIDSRIVNELYRYPVGDGGSDRLTDMIADQLAYKVRGELKSMNFALIRETDNP